MATGLHPFNHIKGVYELTTVILQKDSPNLDREKFDAKFCSFIDQWYK